MIILNKLKKVLKRYSFFLIINAFLKSLLQYLDAKLSDLYYQLMAGDKFNHFLDPNNLRDLVQSNISKKIENLKIKNKGELNILLVYRHSNWEEVLPISLKPFGYVHEFEWGSLGFNENDENWLEKKKEMNSLMVEKYKEVSKNVKIDIVIGYLSGYTVDPVSLDFFSSQGSVVINFCLDDKVNFPGKKHHGIFSSPAALAQKVDLNLTSSPSSVKKYFIHGGPAMFWPEAALPEIHRPYEIPFKYDVSFIGAKYGWRPEFINKLKDKGINIECFGKGWPNGPLSSEEMIKRYSESRINLGFSGIGHSKRLMCLKGRDFEVPMSGGLYLCQNNPELSRVYEVDKEILTYEDTSDCYSKIGYILENPEIAKDIRAAGLKRALRDHTYEKRWEDALKILGLIA